MAHSVYFQELLGHSNIAITLDTYSHVIPGIGGPRSKGHGRCTFLNATFRRTVPAMGKTNSSFLTEGSIYAERGAYNLLLQ
jgi:hypothetical protein